MCRVGGSAMNETSDNLDHEPITKGLGSKAAKLAFVATLLLGLAGCANAAEPIATSAAPNSQAPADANEESESSAPAERTFASEGCLGISEDLLESIWLGMDNTTLTGKAAGFVAAEYQQIKFVAVEFLLNGVADPQVAVFATNDSLLSDSKLDGLIIAADGFAKEFSSWGQALDVEFSIADLGAKESKDCLYLPGASLAQPEPGAATFDEEAFLQVAGDKYGIYDETYDDGSTLTVMKMTRAVCDGNLAVMKKNLGSRWDSSFNKFAIESFCPEKLR